MKNKSFCRACLKSNLKEWLDLGHQPAANAFLSQVDGNMPPEDFYPLRLMRCQDCLMVQLSCIVDPEVLFADYAYSSSTSEVFRDHFKKMAKNFTGRGIISKGDWLVDIGSNDGILLSPFQDAGVNVIGIEPDEALADRANKKGLPTIRGWFNFESVGAAVEMSGGKRPAIITATNVFAHVDETDSFLQNVSRLLAYDGLFVTEFPYFWEMVKSGTFDLIYHEHLSYFSLLPLSVMALRNDFRLIDCEFVPVHGGSLRAYWQRSGNGKTSLRLGDAIQEETRLISTNLFEEFPRLVGNNMRDMNGLLHDLIAADKFIIGYGAPAKMSTLTNYYIIDPSLVKFIIDDAQDKQNKFSPGMHIPVYSRAALGANVDKIDYILIFAWNFADSIMARCRSMGYKGKFILPLPKVKIV